MASLRKLLPVLAMLALVAVYTVPAAAQGGSAFTCTNSGGVPPTVRAEGYTELVGDIVLNCSGTAGVVPAGGITASVQVFLTANITNLDHPLLILNEDVTTAQTGILTVGPGGAISSVMWPSVQVLAAGSTSSIVRITNIRADATTAAPGTVYIPGTIVGYLSITGSTSVPISPSFQTVAYVQNGLGTVTVSPVNLKQCLDSPMEDGEGIASSSLFTIDVSEGFPSAFRQQYDAVNRGGSVDAPVDSVPGAVYADEEGFINADLGTGLATRATPIRLVFNNIPTGTTLSVQTVISAGGLTATLQPTVASPPTYTALTATGSSATAVYWVSGVDPQLNTLEFTGYLTYTSNPGAGIPGTSPAMTVNVGFDPGVATDIPRFKDTSVAKTAATVNACVTNLMWPYVTTAPGFDTGLALSNTSADLPVADTLTPSGPGQDGACSLYLFYADSTGAPTTTTITTPVIKAGTTYAFSLFGGDTANGIAGVSGATGYAIARCNFQYGHGYAFVSPLGTPVTGWAQGYLAVVIPDLSDGTRPPNPGAMAGAGSGESLNP